MKSPVQRYLPFVFPAAAVVLIGILALRWYRTNSITPMVPEQPAQFAEGVSIENLSEVERNSVLRGMSDYKTIELTGGEDVMGQVRYEVKEGKVRFTVLADMPIISEGEYQVWLKDPASEAIKKAFVLEWGKGGYTGSAAISSETLPFEVVITKEMNLGDDTMEEVILRGTIPAEQMAAE